MSEKISEKIIENKFNDDYINFEFNNVNLGNLSNKLKDTEYLNCSNEYNGEWGYSISDWKDRYKY